MKQMYGSSFLSIYGDKPTPVWINSIADLTDDECRVGLSRLAKNGDEYPASLPKFVKACKETDFHGVTFLGVPIDPATLSLPHKKATREHVDGCLARMRAKLK